MSADAGQGSGRSRAVVAWLNTRPATRTSYGQSSTERRIPTRRGSRQTGWVTVGHYSYTNVMVPDARGWELDPVGTHCVRQDASSKGPLMARASVHRGPPVATAGEPGLTGAVDAAAIGAHVTVEDNPFSLTTSPGSTSFSDQPPERRQCDWLCPTHQYRRRRPSDTSGRLGEAAGR